MAYNDFVQSITNAIKDALTLDDVVNGEPNTQAKSRLGRLIYSLATINHRVDVATTQANQKLTDLDDAINTAAAAGAGANGWTDLLIKLASGRNLRDKVSEQVSVKDLGITSGFATDQTVNFNNAIANSDRELFVPDGDYRIDGTVMLTKGKLRFSKNARLIKKAQYTTNTDPVLFVGGWYTECDGGEFVTENNHPNGVVICGQLNKEYQGNALYWRLINPRIKGKKGSADNIGLHNFSSQPYVGDNTANYFGTVFNPIVFDCSYGIVFSEISNSHTVFAPQFWGCQKAAITFYGAYANTIVGGFLHESDNGVIGVNLRDMRFPSAHHSLMNYIYGFNLEPYGDSSMALYIDTNCKLNNISLSGNVPGSSVIKNKNNDYDVAMFNNHRYKTFQGVNVAANYKTLNERHFFTEKTAAEDANIELFRLTSVLGRRSFIIELDVVTNNDELDQVGGCSYKYLVSDSSNGVVLTQVHKAEAPNTPARIDFSVSGKTIYVSTRLFNNGTGTNFKLAANLKLSSLDKNDDQVTVAVL